MARFIVKYAFKQRGIDCYRVQDTETGEFFKDVANTPFVYCDNAFAEQIAFLLESGKMSFEAKKK